jgi:ABC-type molybdate transport system substrate-binding protein
MAGPDNPTPYPVIPANRADDLHHLDRIESADLVLFMAGNQFMVVPPLVRAFQEDYPEIKTVFYETLPPGLELRQILAGGAVFRDRIIDVRPDIYSSVSEDAMMRLENTGFICKGAYQRYLHNRIVLMVPEGNPAGVHAVDDLGRPEVRISQPNPEYEDIAFPIVDMYRASGGEAFVHLIMHDKREAGTTMMTTVHHRETPERLLRGEADVGPVWATEFAHAQRQHLPVDVVEPGARLDQRENVNYFICALQKAPHQENALKFLNFISSSRAKGIYKSFGFVPGVTSGQH